MTALDTPLMTLPPRAKTKPRWTVGDTVVVGSRRWIIRALNAKTRAVYLVAANTVNHAIGWATTIDKLPEKHA